MRMNDAAHPAEVAKVVELLREQLSGRSSVGPRVIRNVVAATEAMLQMQANEVIGYEAFLNGLGELMEIWEIFKTAAVDDV